MKYFIIKIEYYTCIYYWVKLYPLFSYVMMVCYFLDVFHIDC